jgi:CRP-like cAMP-binding protein
MSALHSLHSGPESRLASEGGIEALVTSHSPRQNQLLAALPVEDYARLLSGLEFVSLPAGWTVHGSGELETHLYFPTAGIVSRLCVTEDGASAELAVTGNEGVIGTSLFLGGGSALSEAFVVSAGYAYRLRLDRLQDEIERDGELLRLLLRYTLALIAQTGQIAVCNRHHSLNQQLCRWILSCLDRLPSNELHVTHELIAHMLGVRREGISAAASKLQEAGMLHYHRGHMVILDRHRLEMQACECYLGVKREYDRLLCPEKIGHGAGEYGMAIRHRMELDRIRC